ncbi:hypothetical protein M5K25_001791 [Dendrobium thyrsiflorum]|uniref:Uncharacterized protein n=1 Tax=Dendrobium thyrsiflorum TaxID=117978 RepID=A0ABD0VSP1_DENTH
MGGYLLRRLPSFFCSCASLAKSTAIESNDNGSLLVAKKAHFFECWFKFLCSSLVENQDQPSSSTVGQSDAYAPYLPKKAMVHAALKSLYDIYKCNKHHDIEERFGQLISKYF